MDKKEAVAILQDELLELSMIIEKAKAVSDALHSSCYSGGISTDYSAMQEILKKTDYINLVVIDYLERACKFIECL